MFSNSLKDYTVKTKTFAVKKLNSVFFKKSDGGINYVLKEMASRRFKWEE